MAFAFLFKNHIEKYSIFLKFVSYVTDSYAKSIFL